VPGAKGDSVSLRNYGAPLNALRVVTHGQWIRFPGATTDSLWAEPLDVPNLQQALLLYVPSIHWAYSSAISAPEQIPMVAELLRARGWLVDVVGSPRTPEGTAPGH
jgi:hypothetical protein